MAESGAELASETVLEGETRPQPPEPSTNQSSVYQATPEELVSRSVAPIKKEFLRPPPNRTGNPNDAASATDSKASQSGLVQEKKSKRQIKRERREKAALNLCPEIARTGDVNSCPYNEKCRFNHDLEAFKAQKPEDIEGQCPFVTSGVRCAYGLACRFSGTHGDHAGASDAKENSEMNTFKKETQKLLWKNKMNFLKADAKLESLGLLGHAKKRNVAADNNAVKTAIGVNCSETTEVAVQNSASTSEMIEEIDTPKPVETEEVRPSKKPKSENEENCCAGEVDDGMKVEEGKNGHSLIDTENSIKVVETDGSLKFHPREKKKLIDVRDKLYLAPLTTVGNLPFRRVCKVLGADVTCGEMAMCTNLLQGQASEWALLRRHSSEDLFGVQICGAFPDTVARAVELIDQECTVDFIDINMGCPIDIVVNKGAGSALLTKPLRMKNIVGVASSIVETPITIKVRTGFFEGKSRIDSLIADIGNWGATAVTIHGRSRQQRYSKLADWDYVYQCAKKAPSNLQVIGNGDVFSYLDWNKHKSDCPELSSCMIARGALIKPWLFTEIKEQRDWDITSGERLNILKDFVRFGLEHWGSDTKGVETTRHFLLEWLSYTCRYIPVGLLDIIPQRLNWRPPSYYGRDDLETLMSSDSAADWIRISEMLLGKVPDGFTFAPKHKSNAYDRAENG
ncbi:PREDICTED: tRNA-dihydrouridine(47) synthase [NAD(P)(+)]-like [Tarenaya hassleriana]|uniref:tRNA-dihydrouridine(47) synthase [NAD(P)(+)]-like n=1 Tax=Tarenaya hassleriana TaxID=28532 RepID=UPI00053C68F0|nr:PREDICTED: tRNA-dihydrouridine(47) synthase [NAD(P)(+)]-like [Tarenaya hassleriana]